MRLQIVSDLHVDIAPAALRLAPGAHVLVVAGDTCQGVVAAFRALRNMVPGPVPIVMVGGNHEFYGHVMPEEIASGRRLGPEHGIHFLENEAVAIGGVRFLGCTLWTDFALDGEPWRALAMREARGGMNDYRRIRTGNMPWRRFLPSDALKSHQASRAWLATALAEPFDGPTVVVTHHAPSRRSLNVGRHSSRLDACYASDLDALVATSGAALWIHGHTHLCCDYRIGDTWVINNGRGYGDENARTFDPALVVEVAVGDP